jgi:hypothetical protein
VFPKNLKTSQKGEKKMKDWQKKWLMGFRWTATSLALACTGFLIFSLLFGAYSFITTGLVFKMPVELYLKILGAVIVILFFMAWVEVSIDDYLIEIDPPPLQQYFMDRERRYFERQEKKCGNFVN